MTSSFRPVLASALVALAAFAAPARAQDALPAATASDMVEVGEDVGGGDGARQINIAAGANNQQANIAAFASGDTAIATGAVAQKLEPVAIDPARSASAIVAEGAFASSHGLTAVNIAAGSNNQQANMAVVAFGLEGRVAADAILGRTRASLEPEGLTDDAAAPNYAAEIAPGTFRDSSGIAQVSLIGGTGNSSANIAVLTIEVGMN